jgi:8-oxo-dGTP pyrophosphatase MutT (NUDIX family)
MQISDGPGARLRAARDFRPQGFLPLVLGADRIGWMRRDSTVRLRDWPEVFAVSQERISIAQHPRADVTAAFAGVARTLEREGAIQGWRGETYAVRAEQGGETLFDVERAAMRFFGFTSSAAHLNGFVLENDIASIWIARRAATKAIDPGMLDNLVAGGVASGQDPWQALLRECAEEAGIPLALAQRAQPARVLKACREVPEGLDSEILHNYDLALPADFVPRNADGEVSEFLLLDAPSLLERIARGELTVEAGLVAVDFALRRGLIHDEDGKLGAAIESCRALTPP